EKIRDPPTGRNEDPDEELMGRIERTLGAGQAGPGQAPVRVEEFRRDVISRIAAWSIDHPREKLDFGQVFPRQFQLLRDAYFEERKKLLKKTTEDLLVYLAEGQKGETLSTGIDLESRERVETTLRNMKERYGY